MSDLAPGWEVYDFTEPGRRFYVRDEAGRRWHATGIHCVPQNDLRQHQPTADCWCHPRIEEEIIVVHAAMDGRVAYERGERQPS